MSKPKATKRQRHPKTTFVSFLLDETGSMESIKDDTIGGFNAYVEKLQQSSGDILFSLVSFNSSRRRSATWPSRSGAFARSPPATTSPPR